MIGELLMQKGIKRGLYNRERLLHKCFMLKKRLYEVLRKRSGAKVILFVVGCQRSGTTLVTEIFERDIHAKAYGEFSELSSNDPRRIRLNSFASVKKVIGEKKYPLIVLKPLVESQNLNKMLDYFESSKTLWMYRYYKDVAASNINKFGRNNGINDLRPIIKDDSQNWRSENVSDDTRKVVCKYFSENMNPYDAAALFWFARNKLFFDLDLQNNLRVLVCRYEDLVCNPHHITKSIYRFVDLSYPGDEIISMVHSKSVNKGNNIILSPGIEKLCNDLYQKLEETYRMQQYRLFSLVK